MFERVHRQCCAATIFRAWGSMSQQRCCSARIFKLSRMVDERLLCYTCFKSWAMFAGEVHRASSSPDARSKAVFERPGSAPICPKSRRGQQKSTSQCRCRRAEGKPTWRQWTLRGHGPEHYRFGDCARGLLKRWQLSRSARASAGGETSVHSQSPKPHEATSDEATSVQTDSIDESGGGSPRSCISSASGGSCATGASGASSPSSFCLSDAVCEAFWSSPTFAYDVLGTNGCCVWEGSPQRPASSQRQVSFRGHGGGWQSVEAWKFGPVLEATTCVQAVSIGDHSCCSAGSASNPSVTAHEAFRVSPTFSFEGIGTDGRFSAEGLVHHCISPPCVAMAMALPAEVPNLAELSWGRVSVMPSLYYWDDSDECEAETARDTGLEEIAALRRRLQCLQPNLGAPVVFARSLSFDNGLDYMECANIPDELVFFGTVTSTCMHI